MQIRFTGIKNVGYETRTYSQHFDNDGEGRGFEEVENEYFLNLQLSDDYNGKDLTEFRENVQKTGLKNFSHPLYPDMLSLAISKDVVTEGYSSNVDYQVYINDADKELEVNDNNIPMFSYLARLLNKVAKTPDNKLCVDKDYLADDAAESVILGEDLKDTYGEIYPYEIDRIHSPKVVKNGAAKMSELIRDIMLQYFNS